MGSLAFTRTQRDAIRASEMTRLRKLWPCLEEEFSEPEFVELIFPTRQKAFGQYCELVAEEHARFRLCRQLLTGGVIAISAAALGAVSGFLMHVAGADVRTTDVIVAVACLTVLGAGTLMPITHPRLIVANLVVFLVALVAVPALAAPAGANTSIGGAPRTLLGILVAAAATSIAFAVGTSIWRLGIRSEQKRAREIVPEITAFGTLHAIMTALRDRNAILLRQDRVDLAEQVAAAALAVENIAKPARRVASPEQMDQIRRHLREAASELRRNNGLAPNQDDNRLRRVCALYLMAIVMGLLPGTGTVVLSEQPATERRWANYILPRITVIAAGCLAGLIWTAVTHASIGTGRGVAIVVLFAIVVLAVRDTTSVKKVLHGVFSRLAERFGDDRARNRAERQGDEQ